MTSEQQGKVQVTSRPSDNPVKRGRSGNLIVVTGPSGVGKGTVTSQLLEQVPNLLKSVSATTRGKRPNEVEGVDYFFKTPEEFYNMVEAGLFLEWAEFAGNHYGTPRAWVFEQLKKGIDVILEIEVLGAKQIKESCPQSTLIFLSPPSFEELKSRLKNRATEDPMKMTLRLMKARQELRALHEQHLFHYEVVNDNIEEAVNNLAHIVYAERCRIRENEPNEHDKNS
ncbi:MAG TPA: guanylate kinase [Planktothrix sp.]